MRIVIDEFKVLELKIKQVFNICIEYHLRQGPWLSIQLLSRLFHVIQVEMHVTERMNEFTWLQPNDLSNHHCQQCVGSNVEWDPQKRVSTALIELTVELPFRHMELKKTMAGRQSHFIDEARIPCADHVSATEWVGSQLLNEFDNLVSRRAVRIGPRPPLVPIDGTKVTKLVCPIIPNSYPIFFEVIDIGIAFQEPQQFVDDAAEVQLLGGQYRETLTQIKPHLVTKTPQGARSSAVFPFYTIVHEVLQ